MSKYTYTIKIVRKKCKKSEVLRLRLGTMFASAFAIFFLRVCETCGYCSCTVHEQ